MKKLTVTILFTMILFVLAANTINAQNWTDEQKEVWAGVEKYWEAGASGNVDSFMEYFDDTYTGWSYSSKMPQSKASSKKWIEEDMKNNASVLYSVTPVSIWVKGDFAFVHYYYSQIDKNKETSKNQRSDGNWTDILEKKNGKWLLVGDHGGRTSKPQ